MNRRGPMGNRGGPPFDGRGGGRGFGGPGRGGRGPMDFGGR
eukprot:CAMPEP_0183738622 /NCGR_PEP_ID=MMETSP0737-20130205/55058_1 /TAXON_ID=385413 /ORGANISM="Thalassiosira miniscula, Strain CCMP1093" /LENGTH=40 /DNA_ID= /DNA_START= /DNA_END= /DNA_ORIENTATION=